MKIGDKGPDVAAWQRVIGVTDDGDFGPHTEKATNVWRKLNGLEPTGESLPIQFPFIQAKGRNPFYLPRRLVVIHTMECQERPGKARQTAEWFANKYAPQYPAPQASAHYCVDAEEIVQGVSELNTAWHAGSANPFSIGIEHAGWAAQTANDWEDEYSQAMLDRSARLVASICHRWGIPVTRPGLGKLANGASGIVGHWDCTMAFSGGKGHTDPGPAFPWPQYLERVSHYVNA